MSAEISAVWLNFNGAGWKGAKDQAIVLGLAIASERLLYTQWYTRENTASRERERENPLKPGD